MRQKELREQALHALGKMGKPKPKPKPKPEMWWHARPRPQAG